MNIHQTNSILKPAELVQKVRVGDKSAESEFVNRYSRSLFLMLLKRTNGDDFAAKECTQESLLITLLKMRSGDIREPSQVAAFLRGTAINVSINYYRSQSRYVALKEENIITLRTNTNIAEREIQSEQIRAGLEEMIYTLPTSRDRKILDGYFLHGQQKDALCENLSLSSGHFDRVLSRAKKRLRKIISKNKPLKEILHDEILEEVNEYV